MLLLGLLQLLLLISNTLSLEQSLIWRTAKKKRAEADAILLQIELIQKGDHTKIAQSFSHHLGKNVNGPYDKIFDAGDVEYATKIAIGTPPQEFTVALSTRFGVLAVPHPNCLGWCQNKKKFSFSDSETYVSDMSRWSMSLADQKVSGIVGNDTVTIGGANPAPQNRLYVRSATVGLATEVSLNLHDAPVDGLFGLGLKSSSAKLDPVLQTAYNSYALTFPIFSIWLAPRATKRTVAGAITYGGADNTHCGKVFSSVLVNSANFYRFKIRGVGMGSFRSSPNSEAVSDIGLWIRGPENDVSELARIAGAKYNEGGHYEIPCNATPPAFEVYIEGNTFTVDHTNYIIQAYDGHCIFAFMPQKTPGSTWLLGDPFMREYCHIYNFGYRRISFAESLTRPLPQPSPPTESTRRSTKQQESEETTSVRPRTTTAHKGSASTLLHALILASVLLPLLIIQL